MADFTKQALEGLLKHNLDLIGIVATERRARNIMATLALVGWIVALVALWCGV